MMKLTKKLSALACALLLVIYTSVSVFAMGYLVDDAEMFTADEKAEIEQALSDLSEKTGWDTVVYTNYSGVSADDMDLTYNDYYENSQFSSDGVLLVFDRGYDNRIIITKGDARQYFTDSRMTEIKSEMKPYLEAEDWYNATMTFIEYTDSYFSSEVPEDGDYSNVKTPEEHKKENTNPIVYVFTEYGLTIGIASLVIAGIAVIVVAVRYKHHGKHGTYSLSENSKVNLTRKEDVFLYRTVTSHTQRDDDDDKGFDNDSFGSSGSF